MWVWFLCVAACAFLAEGQTVSPPVSPAELANELKQIESGLDSTPPSLPPSLPDQWDVGTSEGRYSIPTEPLQALLSGRRIPLARQWIEPLAAQLEAYSKGTPESASIAREHLNKILARREFSGVHPPSAWDLFRDRVAAWIIRIVQRLLAAASQYGANGQILFWILVAAAIGILATWLIRLWRRGDPLLTLPRVALGIAARDSEAWLRDSRQAAASGKWREAIHCAYWAAIARLQESRTLPDDRTRTPREYLRLLRSDQPSSGPLRGLTVALERFWYAGQTACARDFEASVEHLESLERKVE